MGHGWERMTRIKKKKMGEKEEREKGTRQKVKMYSKIV
jgi:hypothetical protein